MAAPDPHSLGVPRPQFPRLCPACLPRYSLQTILRRVLNKTEIDAQQNSRAGVAFFPAVQPRAPAVWCFLPPGRVEEVPLLVLEPSARTIAAWHRRTKVWHKATSPCEGAKRLRNRTANDGYSDEKMCPMSRKTRIRCPLP